MTDEDLLALAKKLDAARDGFVDALRYPEFALAAGYLALSARLAEAQQECDEARWIEKRLRQEMWLGHGCGFSALYGDDGEMQCSVCGIDFKRTPIKEVVEFVEGQRQKRLVKALADDVLRAATADRGAIVPQVDLPTDAARLLREYGQTLPDGVSLSPSHTGRQIGAIVPACPQCGNQDQQYEDGVPVYCESCDLRYTEPTYWQRVNGPTAVPMLHGSGAELGSRVVSVGPVSIGCMAKDSRDALDLAIERWREHDAAREPKPDDPVYSFAYWLFRWSGIVTSVNLNAPENPWQPTT